MFNERKTTITKVTIMYQTKRYSCKLSKIVMTVKAQFPIILPIVSPVPDNNPAFNKPVFRWGEMTLFIMAIIEASVT